MWLQLIHGYVIHFILREVAFDNFNAYYICPYTSHVHSYISAHTKIPTTYIMLRIMKDKNVQHWIECSTFSKSYYHYYLVMEQVSVVFFPRIYWNFLLCSTSDEVNLPELWDLCSWPQILGIKVLLFLLLSLLLAKYINFINGFSNLVSDVGLNVQKKTLVFITFKYTPNKTKM